MDANIRQLLAASNAVGNEADSRTHLLQAYKLLDAANKESGQTADSSPCGADLYVIAAEIAIRLHESKVAEGALQMYFQGTQLTDQFLCRAYLCKAQLLSSKSPNSSSDLDSAVVFLLKAISFAKDKPRYHFIVYNASVLFWQMARPFLRPGYRGLLHLSLQQIVKALNEIDDPDYDWRATLMISLVESLVDAGKTKEAVAASETAAEFTLKYAKLRFKDVFKLQIQHKLVEQNKLTKSVNNIPEFLAFLKLQKLKRNLSKANESDKKIDLNKELSSLVNLVNQTGSRSLGSPTLAGSRKKSGQATESSVDSLSRVSSVSPQRRRSRTMSKASLDIPIDLMSEMGRDLLPNLLLELARYCADCGEVKLARKCIESLDVIETDPGIDLEIECLKCYLIVKDLGDMEEVYTQSSVDVRLFAVKRMDQNIQNATRSGKAHVVQAACATQWNLCLPLLQTNLRKHVRRPLTLVAQSLEDIASLEIQLRCQVHTELAKCEEDVEQVEAALRHIRKALQLDQSGLYHQRLHTMLRRLELSTQLYQSPETPEDSAAVIIEQARKSADSGSVRMKRSLLVKAGLALAPDAFQYVLDSEGEVKVAGQKTLSIVQLLGSTAFQWQKCVKKAAGHLKRLGDENDRERARLWGDLAKVARGQEVWDVCRVAARFCLLYDDGRWENSRSSPEQIHTSSVPTSAEAPKSQEATSDAAPVTQNQVAVTSSTDPVDRTHLHDTDLLRMLAEVHFINGEALVHLLQCQGLKLNQAPRFPTDAHQRPKSSAGFKMAEIDPDWMTYTEWIKLLSNSSTRSFLRAIELGVRLRESWIVCSGTAYLWNYNKHLISDGQLSHLIEVFEAALTGLRAIGHSSEIVLLVRVCNLISQGLLRPWLVSKPPTDPSADPSPDAGSSKPPSRKKTPGKDKPSTGASGAASIVVEPESQDDLKKALEITEYALDVTRGGAKKDIVPTAVRQEILSTWVLLKQMLQQQIGAGLGVENELIPSQRDMTKALIMLEMHTLNRNGMMELTVPALNEAAEATENCEWDDPSIELEVWSRLAFLSHCNKEHDLVVKCAKKGIAFETSILKNSRRGKMDKTGTKSDFEMLSSVSCILGESIMTTVLNNPYARRQAMDAFEASARFADLAGNYKLVMSACSWWWNACLPLMSSSIERELLRQPLNNLLHYVTSTATKMKAFIEMQEKEEAASKAVQTTQIEKLPAEQDSHNSLRAAMYGVLFQTYTDKNQWEEALSCMDQAIQHMPRTKHRLPIFKNRIMVKAKLGRSVHADIAKFREESEEYVAHMWHRVAISSHEQLQQLGSYQKAIESLHTDVNLWKKVDYLSELSTWLYCSEYPLDDSVNILEWAVDILFSMKFEELPKEEKVSPAKGKRKTPGKTPAKTPASRGSPKTRDTKRSVKIDEKSRPETKDTAKSVENKSAKNEENLDEIVPIEKEVIIGLENANIELKFNELNSVRQLEVLIRTHVMLATISGRGSSKHKSYILLAAGYIIRLWEIALAAAGPLVSQLPKIEDKPGNPPPAKEKQKGPLEALPNSTIEWANYIVPEDIIRAFSFNQGDTAISTKTITKPALTIHYLEELLNELCFLGYNHLSIPVLCLADTIILGIFESESWSNLMCLHKIQICYDLGLVEIAKKWEVKLSDVFLPLEEQSTFIQECELMDQHAKQVQYEEARLKGKALVAKEAGDNTSQLSHAGSEPITLQGRKIKGICMRLLWMEKGMVLLGLGYHQRARELFNQAMRAAIAVNDQTLIGDIYLGMAQLSIQESNLGQSMRFLKKAQDVGGDEKYWYKVVLMLADSIVLDPDVTPAKRKEASKLLRIAVETMEILKMLRPTKKSTISYIISMIRSYSAFMKFDILLLKDGPMERQVHTNLSKLDEAENILFSCGYIREAVQLYQKHAFICLKLCNKTSVLEEQHSFLLNGLEKLEHAAQIMSELYTEVSSGFADINDNPSISLPIARELCNTLLSLAEYLLYLYDINAKEQILKQKMQAKSGSLEHIVNEYVCTEKNLSRLEQEWKEMCELLPQKMFSTFMSAFSFSVNIPENRAKSLYLIGRSLHLLGLYLKDDIDGIWSVLAFNITAEISSEEIQLEEPIESHDFEEKLDIERIGSTKSKSSMDSTLTNKQRKKLAENAARIMKGEQHSKTYLCQAMEILLQSIKMSLEHKFLHIVRDASLEIVEICGQSDPSTASLYLALHQSAKSSLNFKEFLLRSQPDPASSHFAALLHQATWLAEKQPHMKVSSLFGWVKESLRQFTSWKRLNVFPTSLDLIKDFPPNFNFVILQHSPDKRYLYASLLDKPKANPTAGDAKGKSKEKQSQSASDSRSVILRADVNPDVLDSLKERMEEYTMHLMSLLLQSEYQRAQAALREKMLQELSVGNNENTDANVPNTILEEQEEEEMRIMDEFQDIVDSLERYLISFTTMLKDNLIDPLTKECKEQIEQGQPADVNAMESIVLLIDEDLMGLPLEALKCFQSPFIDCMCRDFSLQMSHHRWHVDPEEAAALAEKKKNEPPPKGNPKTPKTGKDTRKTPAGGGKVVPLNREVLPGCSTINTNYVLYMVDPLDEAAETETYKPMEIFKQMMQTYSTSCTSAWSGWYGSSGVPSVGQWENLINGCESFIFYGMERFFAHMPPSKVAALDLSGCQMVLLLDKAQTSKSFRHQSKVDVDKSDSLLALEKPLYTIMMLSLVGVNTVCSNLWHSTLEDNANKLQCITRVILEDGQVVGKAVRSLLNPTLVKPVPPEPPATAPTGKERSDTKNAKSVKGKPDSKKGKSPAPSPLPPTPEPEISESPVQTEGEPVEEIAQDESVQASWCNMIVFGLPNVMVV
ncbi:cilia- and flagella-associated protein 46-like [Styela clava]